MHNPVNRSKWTNSMRSPFIALLTLLVFPLITVEASGQEPSGEVKSGENHREGEVIRMAGTFRETSDRVTFYRGGSRETAYTVLENLALERVVNSLTGTRKPRVWDIKAVLTEYQGVNYLLLKHAVMQPLNE